MKYLTFRAVLLVFVTAVASDDEGDFVRLTPGGLAGV